MQELLMAIIAVGVGAIFCFSGYTMMRILLPLWGLVAGYWLGAQFIYNVTDDGFLSTTLAILTGVIFALIGALLAYLYYSIAILLFMGIVGFWLGSGLMNLIGFEEGFLSSIIGFIFALGLVMVSLFYNAPKLFLLFVTALAGAALAISGVLLLTNDVSIDGLRNGAFNVIANSNWFWQLIWVGLSVFGLSTQVTASQKEELEWEKAWIGGKK